MIIQNVIVLTDQDAQKLKGGADDIIITDADEI